VEAGRPAAVRPVQWAGRRAEYWWFVLANLIVTIVLSILARVSTTFAVVYALYGLALLIPGIAVAIRRLHDTNRSGWWLLLALIPLVGIIILIVFLATDGDRGVNRFVPRPLPFVTA
jgi:uncharacterized membrane protein YhaH (DUF805 family)